MSLNVSKKDKSISRSHSYSPRQERQFAKDYGGELVPNSGRGSKKGDSTITLPAKIAGELGEAQSLREPLKLMVDNKATIHKSYSLSTKTLTKLIEQALSENMLPVLHVELNCDTVAKEEVVILPMITFNELMERIK